MVNKGQSKTYGGRRVKYPNLRKIAAEMGYNFSYLYRVLEGTNPHFKGRKGLKEEYWKVSARIASEKAPAR